MTVTVLPKQVGSVSVANANLTLKAGDEVEIVVKVSRSNDYNDGFDVKLVLPKDVTGISADEVTIPAGQSEVKLILHADEDAAPGPRNNIGIVATAVLQGVTLTHEIKINVVVQK